MVQLELKATVHAASLLLLTFLFHVVARKKPPIQYVRCEMEGCGTVLAHPRYLQVSGLFQGRRAHRCCPLPVLVLAETF